MMIDSTGGGPEEGERDMGVRALILINDSGAVAVQRQLEACWDYINSAPEMRLAGLLRAGSDGAAAAAAIADDQGDVIVAAYRDPDMELTVEIERVGGHVEYVQAPDAGKLTVRGIIANLHRRFGWPPATIARAIGASVRDVSDHLRRSGIRPPTDK